MGGAEAARAAKKTKPGASGFASLQSLGLHFGRTGGGGPLVSPGSHVLGPPVTLDWIPAAVFFPRHSVEALPLASLVVRGWASSARVNLIPAKIFSAEREKLNRAAAVQHHDVTSDIALSGRPPVFLSFSWECPAVFLVASSRLARQSRSCRLSEGWVVPYGR